MWSVAEHPTRESIAPARGLWSGTNSVHPLDLARTALAFWQRWFPEEFERRRPFTDRFELPPWWPHGAECVRRAMENRQAPGHIPLYHGATAAARDGGGGGEWSDDEQVLSLSVSLSLSLSLSHSDTDSDSHSLTLYLSRLLARSRSLALLLSRSISLFARACVCVRPTVNRRLAEGGCTVTIHHSSLRDPPIPRNNLTDVT